jgi:hypothetical protein
MKEEIFHLELFINLFSKNNPSWLDSDCVLDFGDKPDLVVQHKNVSVGIEHTRLYRENPVVKSGGQLVAQEKLQWNIVDRAYEMFRSQFSDPISIRVDFKEPFTYQKSDVEQEAKQLVLSVINVLSRFPESYKKTSVTIKRWIARKLGIPFPAGVRAYIIRVEPYSSLVFWGPMYGYMVPTLEIQQVAQRIKDKEKRINEYKSRCNKVWLLIIAHAGTPSSHFEITDTLREYIFITEFDRIFLLLPFIETLIELKTQHQKQSSEISEHGTLSD